MTQISQIQKQMKKSNRIARKGAITPQGAQTQTHGAKSKVLPLGFDYFEAVEAAYGERIAEVEHKTMEGSRLGGQSIYRIGEAYTLLNESQDPSGENRQASPQSVTKDQVAEWLFSHMSLTGIPPEFTGYFRLRSKDVASPLIGPLEEAIGEMRGFVDLVMKEYVAEMDGEPGSPRGRVIAGVLSLAFSLRGRLDAAFDQIAEAVWKQSNPA